MTERDPQGKGGQGQPAADPRSGGPPAPRRGAGTYRGIYLPGGALAWRRRRSLRAGLVGKTWLLFASIHTWTLLRTSQAGWPPANGGSNGRPAGVGFRSVKALVLAGGSGTRLRPITHTSAKQLVPVANKPVLFYGLEAIRDAGITDVGIVVGDTEPAIRSAVGSGQAFGLEVTYIRQSAPLGLAHAVLMAREFLADDDFVMYLGDNFVVGGITALVTEFRASRPDAQIMLTSVQDPRQFGVAEFDGAGQLIGLEEKPQQPKSDLALVGVYLFTPAVHEAVAALAPSQRGELEITEAIQWLIANGRKVSSTIISGYWKDTGNVADMLEVNRIVLESVEAAVAGEVDAASELIGRVVIDAGARVSASRIVGPAIIGAGTEVTDSYVGPFTSIGPGCVIADSEIEYSIVLARASIRGVRRIEASLIGHYVEVTPAPRVCKAHRLVLGDHSKVQISP